MYFIIDKNVLFGLSFECLCDEIIGVVYFVCLVALVECQNRYLNIHTHLSDYASEMLFLGKFFGSYCFGVTDRISSPVFP